jgi:hypothetical protein
MEPYQFEPVTDYQQTFIWHNTATPDLSKEQRLGRNPRLRPDTRKQAA